MKRCAAALAVLTLVACSTARSAPADDDAAVRAAMTRLMDALNALDLPTLEATFADDVTAFVPLAQPDLVRGKPALTQIFRAFIDRTRPTTPRLHLVPEDLQTAVSGDLGVVTFQIRETAPPVTRRRTFVFRRAGDTWLLVHMHASDFR